MRKEITSAMIKETLINYHTRTAEINKEMIQSYEKAHANSDEFIQAATFKQRTNEFHPKSKDSTDISVMYERYLMIVDNNIDDILAFMTTIIDEQETMNRIMVAYSVLPANEKKLLYLLYQNQTHEKMQEIMKKYSTLSSITLRSVYRLKSKAFFHIKEIYQSPLTHAEIYELRSKSIDEMLSYMEKNNKNK